MRRHCTRTINDGRRFACGFSDVSSALRVYTLDGRRDGMIIMKKNLKKPKKNRLESVRRRRRSKPRGGGGIL